jgi:hypothetical protein
LEARKAVEQDGNGGWRVALEATSIGGRQCEKLTESAEAGPSARRSIDAIAATLCGRSDQTDYLRGEIGKEAPQLMTNTSIRMLRCGATVSWPSGCWWSDNGTSVAHPWPPLLRRWRFGRRWFLRVVSGLATTLAALRTQV